MKIKNLGIIAAVFALGLAAGAAGTANAGEIFKTNEGIYSPTPDLIENDRGLLCVLYSKEECANGQFKVISANGSTDGSFWYELEYSLGNHTCRATIGKFLSPPDWEHPNLWATLSLKSGQACIDRQSL